MNVCFFIHPVWPISSQNVPSYLRAMMILIPCSSCNSESNYSLSYRDLEFIFTSLQSSQSVRHFWILMNLFSKQIQILVLLRKNWQKESFYDTKYFSPFLPFWNWWKILMVGRIFVNLLYLSVFYHFAFSVKDTHQLLYKVYSGSV